MRRNSPQGQSQGRTSSSLIWDSVSEVVRTHGMTPLVEGMGRVSSAVVGKGISLGKGKISLVQKRKVSSMMQGMISLVVGDP